MFWVPAGTRANKSPQRCRCWLLLEVRIAVETNRFRRFPWGQKSLRLLSFMPDLLKLPWNAQVAEHPKGATHLLDKEKHTDHGEIPCTSTSHSTACVQRAHLEGLVVGGGRGKEVVEEAEQLLARIRPALDEALEQKALHLQWPLLLLSCLLGRFLLCRHLANHRTNVRLLTAVVPGDFETMGLILVCETLSALLHQGWQSEPVKGENRVAVC